MLESMQTDIVDWVFANQVGFLNLQGIGRAERACKVDRLQEILESVETQQPEETAEDEGSQSYQDSQEQ